MLGIVIAAAVAGELLGAPLGAIAHAIGTEIVFSAVFFVVLYAILRTQGMILEDRQLLEDVTRRIRGERINAESALGQEMRRLDQDGLVRLSEASMFDVENLRGMIETYVSGCSPAFYKFVCRHCARVHYNADCD